MALATWWANDPLPELTEFDNFSVRIMDDPQTMAKLNRIDVQEVETRWNNGHRPYVASVGDTPAAYGWVAVESASIGELDLAFTLPQNERYLWDFATLPEWRGQGIYPRLLQQIVQHEDASRCWIIYAPENLPSGSGIGKAGFSMVGQLSFLPEGEVALAPFELRQRAQAGASLLGVPMIEDDLSPCWRCVETLICSCRYSPEACSCAYN